MTGKEVERLRNSIKELDKIAEEELDRLISLRRILKQLKPIKPISDSEEYRLLEREADSIENYLKILSDFIRMCTELCSEYEGKDKHTLDLAIDPDYITCPNCGMIIKKENVFCPNCGSSISYNTSGNHSSPGASQGGFGGFGRGSSQGGFGGFGNASSQDGFGGFGNASSQDGYQPAQSGYSSSQGGYQPAQSGYSSSQGGFGGSGECSSHGGYESAESSPQPIEYPIPGNYDPGPALPSQQNAPRKKKFSFWGSLTGIFKHNKKNTSPEQNPPSEVPAITKVEFSAIAPKSMTAGTFSIINLVMYEKAFREEVDRIIAEAEAETTVTSSGKLDVKNCSEIRILLSANDKDIFIPQSEETRIWTGEYLNFTFPVSVPETFTKTQILFTASVYINSIIAAHLNFIVNCLSSDQQRIIVEKHDIMKAFVSYASPDRSRVATIIEGMQAARKDLDIFFDVEKLRTGEKWKEALADAIDGSDIMYLCWSTAARQSTWVDWEWRYAYNNKGLDFIEPVPLESPDLCSPPEELKSKHFNNMLLYIIHAGISNQNTYDII